MLNSTGNKKYYYTPDNDEENNNYYMLNFDTNYNNKTDNGKKNNHLEYKNKNHNDEKNNHLKYKYKENSEDIEDIENKTSFLTLKCLSEEAKKLDNSVKVLAFFIYIYKKEFLNSKLELKDFMECYIKLNSGGDVRYCIYKIETSKNPNYSFSSVLRKFKENNSLNLEENLSNEKIDEFIDNFAKKFTNLKLEVIEVDYNPVRDIIIGIVAFSIIAGIVFVCTKKSNSNNESKNDESEIKIKQIKK